MIDPITGLVGLPVLVLVARGRAKQQERERIARQRHREWAAEREVHDVAEETRATIRQAAERHRQRGSGR